MLNIVCGNQSQTGPDFRGFLIRPLWVKKLALLLPYILDIRGVHDHEAFVLADFVSDFVITVEG